MRKIICVATVCLLCLFLTACGGGSSQPLLPSSISVNPSSAVVPIGSTKMFTATDPSGAPVSVNWSASGPGTIDPSGNFAAPPVFPLTNFTTITATLRADATKRASASATIVFPNDNSKAQGAPIKLGTTGGNSNDVSNGCCSGTLGSLVSRAGTFFILSNNHVLDRSDQGKVGEPIVQPGLTDNSCGTANAKTVANVSQAAPLQTSNVDAALAQVVAGMVDTGGAILDLGPPGPASIDAVPPSSTPATPTIGQGVAKSGRTTGLTCATIGSIATNVSVSYQSSCNGPTAFTVFFLNQIVISSGGFATQGDSGSLIVTSDTRQPIGLFFAANGSSSAANPIQDVLNALQDGSGNVPTIVGPAGPQQAVSCDPEAPADTTQPVTADSFSHLSAEEQARVTKIVERLSSTLNQDPQITRVEAGASRDNPREGALVLHVTGTPSTPVPPQIEGVRTRIVYDDGARKVSLASPDVQRAIGIKDLHADSLMHLPDVTAVGVGQSADDPKEPALVIYVDKDMPRSPILQEIDGIRTKIIEGGRFYAFGSGRTWGPKP